MIGGEEFRDEPMIRSSDRPIVIVALPLPIHQEFSYRVPAGMEAPAEGSRVRVPFGERILTGVVTGAASPDAPASLRDLIEALDQEPACTPEMLATAARVAERFFVSRGEVLKSALPARLPAGGAVRYRITERGALAKASEKEREILDRLADGRAVRITELPLGGRLETLRALEERGWIRPVAPAKPVRRTEVAYLPAKLVADERSRRLGRSRRGADVMAFLDELSRPATAAEISASTGVSASVVRSLAARGLLLSFG